MYSIAPIFILILFTIEVFATAVVLMNDEFKPTLIPGLVLVGAFLTSAICLTQIIF